MPFTADPNLNPGSPPSAPADAPAAPADAPPRRLSWALGAAVMLLAAVLPAVLWPGDTPWTNDEPALIAHALRANRAFHPAFVGLAGNMNVCYGPLPTEIYQVLLLLTHDPVVLVALRAALCGGTTALSLLWLARALQFSPWLAAAVMLAPFVYLFQRVLWDATFVVPLGTLALAALASFLHGGSRRSLLTALACAGSLPLIHPQTLPLTAAIVGCLVWRHRPALRRHRRGVLAVMGGLALLNAGYLAYVGHVLLHLPSYAKGGYSDRLPPWRAALTPLRAGQWLWENPLAAGVGRLGGVARLVGVARGASSVIELLVWVGMAVAVWRVTRRRGPATETGSTEKGPPTVRGPAVTPGVRATRDQLLRVALAALAMQMALYAAIGLPRMVSYYFGPFPTTVLFAWVAVEWLSRLRLGRLHLGGAVIAVYGLCVAVGTLVGVWQIHRLGWPKGAMSPTMSNQQRVARALNRYADDSASTDVGIYQNYPWALWTLRALAPPPGPAAGRIRSGRLVIRWCSRPTGGDGWIELAEGDAPPGAKAVKLDGTPP